MPSPTGYTVSLYSKLTGNKAVDSLLSGTYWAGVNWPFDGPTKLTYSFIEPGTSYFATNYSADNEYQSIYSLTGYQKNGITAALATWSAVANISFTETTDDISNVGDLRFGGYGLMGNQAAAWAYTPSTAPRGGDVWIGEPTTDYPIKGTYDYMTYIHEIGHALGLKHPFSASATNTTLLDPSLDDVRYTVMSYNNSYSSQPTTPMVLDILAIQALYGANMNWQTGDNVYSWQAYRPVFETIWDAGGNDTIDASSQGNGVTLDLNEGAYSSLGLYLEHHADGTVYSFNSGLAIAFGAKIENATGSTFDDILYGNALDNVLNGNTGKDYMYGGAGNDIYVVDNVGDVVIETSTVADEIDTVRASVSYTLSSNLENLQLTGNASVNAVGNNQNNVLTGNAGSNVLDGMGGLDTMIGGAGNDAYVLDQSGELNLIKENANEGSDTLILAYDVQGNTLIDLNSSTLSNFEHVTLKGVGAFDVLGNAQDNYLFGNASANTLQGGAGNDLLDGGVGNDTLIGGTGNDTYVIDSLQDSVIEQANEGRDLVRTSVTYTLGANLEEGELVGNAALNLTGNELNNVLTGNSGDNLIDGGLGADSLIGGLGNDTYIVDNLGDTITETSTLASEIDAVWSWFSWTLGANLENLFLAGPANLNGTGNELANYMIGNSGANVLDGGLGADKLIGGLGNDTYIVDNLGDTITETSTLAGEIDTVRSSVDWRLGANLENLVLTGNAINGTGNELNNSLTGNAAANTLDGGLGADTMIGGDGSDTYYVDNVGDVVIETDASLTALDRVFSSIDYTLVANVENLTLMGSANLNGTGNSVNNTLTGNAGANILDGGLGADSLIGGLGSDTYIVDNLGDTITETSTLASEIDAVWSWVNWTLGANLENLFLAGTANLNGVGNGLNNYLIGNSGNNVLSGGAGDDTLDGGIGADAMVGGDGNDSYYVDNVGDLVIETDTSPNAIDRVFSSINYTLGANLENLTLLGSANLNGTGNAANNVLTGNEGANILDGGLGADKLIGGLGNDTYIVDNLGDTVTETSTLAGEVDTVRSSVDWRLGANLENLVLTGNAVNGTGNELNNSLTGNAAANTLDGGLGADTMIGGDGSDTYYVDNVGDIVIETDASLTALDRVFSSIDYTLVANVENLTLMGSANLNGTGNSVNNTLTGNAGANILDGGLGADSLIGGLGNDTYIVDNLGDTITETSTLAGEIDSVWSWTNWTLGANLENLFLAGTANLNGVGNGLNNYLIGNSGNNVLSGGAGDDTLDGGIGADAMVGGDGNDSYYVDNVGDLVIETDTSPNAIDRVFSSINYTLGTNLENLTLLGSANLNGTGNAANNVLTGNEGANILDGGLGADKLIGGLGNDTYIVDNLGDTVTETSTLAGEIDTVRSSVDWRLGANLENLVLTGNAINGTGNELNNSLTGNAAANTLDGGLGADTMIGGDGSDTYYVDNVGDIVIETDASLTALDRVFSSIDYTLVANVENLTLMGSANLNGTGNSVNNTLTGNSGDNLIDGGLGADSLIGGLGNDTYIVDNLGDTITETSTLASEIDAVWSWVNWTLGANLENLFLAGPANLNGTGNELANYMIGNSGANVLDGGLGADKLIGGLGNDTYIVDNLGDTVTETSTLAGEIDTVRSSVDWRLGANLENLVLTGNAINGTGNELNNSLTGNAAANTLDGGLGADTMIGGDGSDTYYVDNVGDIVIETDASLTALDRVFSSIDYTLVANVENLTLMGSANLNGTGNSVNNTLTGNAGANILDGGLGADSLIGGLGSDTYIVDNLGDTITETSTLAGEIDSVWSWVNWTLGANLENLFLAGTANLNGVGNGLNNYLIGNSGNNVLSGGAGDDTLDGGIGADAMVGGDGNDSYYVDNVGDLVIETDTSPNAIDRVFSSINYTLGANLENLTLLGSANLNGTGNAANNVITGNEGANVLDGGLGSDTLIGGLGNDTYIVDGIDDIIRETSTLAGEIDTVRASVDWTLGANLENLVLTGNAMRGTGNDLNNVLIGNSENNTLNGGAGDDILDGGLGQDLMRGGAGSDTYYVDDDFDFVMDMGGSASDVDQVISTISYTLVGGIENLTLAGTANLNGTGNDQDNVINGNAANNTLDGGAGVDTLIGGAGDDIYIVDNSQDVVIEQIGEGHDLIRTNTSYTLSANIEDLTMIGDANSVLTGNALNNVIRGNSATNNIDGGLGADTMIGGGGHDTYIVDNINDIVIELADEGIDTVNISVDYTLTANVEDGQMLGNANLNLTGNALDNVLHGNSGNNILSGGLGADRMIGEGGDDIYIVDNVNDLVFESPLNGGHDLIQTWVDYGLSDNVEDGVLLGNADLTLSGNNLDNVLTGNSGNNTLMGFGGTNQLFGAEGNDTLFGGWGSNTLTGGTGSDTFTFNNWITLGPEMGMGPADSQNIITDFSALDGDKIDFSGYDMDPLTLGVQHMTFIGSNEFTGAGQLRFVDQVLLGNVSGDLGADFQVQLLGVHTLSANDVLV
ncbi:M10 family metallopeptidase [Pseudomonas fluorescens]|uniref:M10 family metallopeptidase n=1 Tax=Pseudomonas TaxID=286 RepID=UPI0024B56606|nr:M10 family metallopeptidase [Pseudomonas fluorescens]